MSATDRRKQGSPISIVSASRQVVTDCVRRWAAGAALDERECQMMADALALNRVDLLQRVFAEREHIDAGR